MANEPSYTNVRMDANSALGQWWRHQSDRDYSMQVLVQLANQKFGKNVDLKAYSLQQMINGTAAPATSQPQTTVDATPENNTVTDQPVQREADELPPSQKTASQQTAAPNQQPSVPPTTVQPTTANSASAAPDSDDDALVHDALFGGAAKPVKKARKPGQSFRDQL